MALFIRDLREPRFLLFLDDFSNPRMKVKRLHLLSSPTASSRSPRSPPFSAERTARRLSSVRQQRKQYSFSEIFFPTAALLFNADPCESLVRGWPLRDLHSESQLTVAKMGSVFFLLLFTDLPALSFDPLGSVLIL